MSLCHRGKAISAPSTELTKLNIFLAWIFVLVDRKVMEQMGLRLNKKKKKKNKNTAKALSMVDDETDLVVKKLHYLKYSTKRSDFLRFCDYLCHHVMRI